MIANSLAHHVSPELLAAAIEWEKILKPIAEAKKGRLKIAREQSIATGIPQKTLLNKYYIYKEKGISGLIDTRKAPTLQKAKRRRGLSPQDRETFRAYVENNQRVTSEAIKQFQRDWVDGKIFTTTPVDPRTGYPCGWTERNFYRAKPPTYDIIANRIGRTAAASHRPLVYTTRRDYYVGQFFLFDDMWHDHFVNNLDTRQTGRPLEFHCLDLSSACKNAWGIRLRTEVDGTNEGLKRCDFNFLLAAMLTSDGYHPNGTTLVVEHGTAAISELIERVLFDATGGAIKVARSGMQGAPAHDAQYAGRAKGNFRFKSALESVGNLYHNAFAALPGQTGKDRDHRPEQLHGLLKHNDALLKALASLPPERAAWLQWDLCTLQQFVLIAQHVYARLNQRDDHNLEGWDERYVQDQIRGGMRRMSPWEVWSPGRRALQPIPPDVVALILDQRAGTERMTRNGMIEIRDSSITGDLLRYDAHLLPDREKFLTVLNPFSVDSLFCYDAQGRFVSALERIASVSRADLDAVHRACGAASKRESEMLAATRRRHAPEAMAKAERQFNNAAVIDLAKREGSLTPIEELREADKRDAVSAVSVVEETLKRKRAQEAESPVIPAEDDWA